MTKYVCRVSHRLFEDWESRGLIHNMEQDGTLRTFITMRGKGRRIECTAEVLRGLRADAEWLLDPSMGQDRTMRIAARKFIADADLVLTETQLAPALQKGTR